MPLAHLTTESAPTIGDSCTFSAAECDQLLPKGWFTGDVTQPTNYLMGDNAMGLQWAQVTITEYMPERWSTQEDLIPEDDKIAAEQAREWIGKQVNVRYRVQSAETNSTTEYDQPNSNLS